MNDDVYVLLNQTEGCLYAAYMETNNRPLSVSSHAGGKTEAKRHHQIIAA